MEGSAIMWIFIAIVVGVWAIGALLEKASVFFQAAQADREHRRALEDLYRYHSVNTLRAIASSLDGPPLPPLSARLSEVGRDVKRRRELGSAMERELGVK